MSVTVDDPFAAFMNSGPVLPDTGFIPSGFLNPGVSGDGGDDPAGDSPPADAGPTCQKCGRDIEWSGRGRRPKWCLDHRTRTTSEPGDSPARGPRSADKKHEARVNKIIGDLQEGLGGLSATLMPFAPVTAMTVAMQGPPAMENLVHIAEQYPRFLDGLEKAAIAVPFISVAKFVAAIILAMLVDLRQFTPEGMGAELLGVAAAAKQAGWEPPPAPDDPRIVEGFAVPTPSRPAAGPGVFTM